MEDLPLGARLVVWGLLDAPALAAYASCARGAREAAPEAWRALLQRDFSLRVPGAEARAAYALRYGVRSDGLRFRTSVGLRHRPESCDEIHFDLDADADSQPWEVRLEIVNETDDDIVMCLPCPHPCNNVELKWGNATVHAGECFKLRRKRQVRRMYRVGRRAVLKLRAGLELSTRRREDLFSTPGVQEPRHPAHLSVGDREMPASMEGFSLRLNLAPTGRGRFPVQRVWDGVYQSREFPVRVSPAPAPTSSCGVQ